MARNLICRRSVVVSLAGETTACQEQGGKDLEVRQVSTAPASCCPSCPRGSAQILSLPSSTERIRTPQDLGCVSERPGFFFVPMRLSRKARAKT